MKKRRNYLATCFGVVILLLNQSASAEKPYVDVIESLAQQTNNIVKYEETYEAFYLDEPLKSRGELRFEPPDKLVKTVKEPEFAVQEIEGDEVVVKWENGKIERFSLEQHRGLKSMAYTLRSLLTGNADYFEKNYQIDYSENEGNWKLILIPLDTDVKKWIKDVVIIGENGKLTQYTITEINGDHTTTRLYE